jgi:hypothetical protein
VDFRRKRIAITPKDRSNPREAVVTNELLPAIQRLVERARNASEECLVQGDGMAFLSNMFAKWQERLDEPRLNGRRLRQSAITGVLMEGASLLEAAQFAGHVKVSTTDLYVQTATNRQANVAASLSKHLAPEESNGEDASGPGRSPRGSSR